MEHDVVPKRRPLFDLFFSYLDHLFPSDRAIIYVLLIVFVSASSIALLSLNNAYSTVVPSEGGVLIEGMIGSPRFVNPALAITRTDTDLVALTYSGLLKLDENGNLIPDLAESITISEDGLVYNVILRNDIQFHDGTAIRSDDVAYTIALIQDPELKSPLRGNWSGVTVEVIDDRELNFILEKAYAPFSENLTVGIMPKTTWDSLSIEELPFSQHNAEPIGSGPYKLASVTRDNAGLINGYELKAFSDGRETSKISTIIIKFYQNEDELLTAYQRDEITSSGMFSLNSLNAISDNSVFIEQPLPRIFSVFLNQNKSPVLRDENARKALHTVINRTALVEEVLKGYGTPTTSPIPPGFLENDETQEQLIIESATTTPLEHARTLLQEGGWTQNEAGTWSKEIDGTEVPLRVTLATSNTEIFKETALYLEQTWSELGVEVNVELYEQSGLVQTIIRPRDYEALLFGIEIGRSMDLYPFWHSSQREDPGLNVALYANITTDALLETIRTTQDQTERLSSIRAFESEILEEMPAIFLYSPSFVYVAESNITTAPMRGFSRPSDRFSNITNWHINEMSLWNVFVNN